MLKPAAEHCMTLLTCLAHAAFQEKLNTLEAELQQWRNQMALGWTDQSGQLHKASSVQLRNTMRTDADESVRKACWEVQLIKPACNG